MGNIRDDYSRTGIQRELEYSDFTVDAKKGIKKYTMLSADEMRNLSNLWKSLHPNKGINNYKLNFYEFVNKKVKR